MAPPKHDDCHPMGHHPGAALALLRDIGSIQGGMSGMMRGWHAGIVADAIGTKRFPASYVAVNVGRYEN